MELEENTDGTLLFSNTHLILTDEYYTKAPIFLKLMC
jgi:hypothetical protein